MGRDSGIQWTHHTFNPWRGCTHVSPGCENCYAEALAKRNPAQLGTWGAGGTRVVASDAYWRQPHAWNRAAVAAGERHRVFCASLADVFEDRPELADPRHRLWSTIVATPHLDWLLLTKRPEAIARLVGGWPWPANIWLGTTVEDQRRADERIPVLLDTPAAVRFLSCEPLLGPLDLGRFMGWRATADVMLGRHPVAFDAAGLPRAGGVDWLIVGGESGPRARPFDLAWARSIRDQGDAAGVPVFIKQLGRRPHHGVDHQEPSGVLPLVLRDSHGGDPEEWPEDLRVRLFPTPAAA